MTMRASVAYWINLDESTKIEDQAKAFIASSVESYLNGIQDGYKPMTRQEWKQYIFEDLNRDIRMNTIVNGTERKHMRFLGNKRFQELVDIYLERYKPMKNYIID